MPTSSLRQVLAVAALTAASCLAEEFTLVRDGQPVATIVLPAQTELHAYQNPTPEAVDAFLKGRFAQADEARLAELRKALAEHRAKEAKRVGDEEELAVTELQTIVEQISGAKLPVVRLAAGAELPAGPVVLVGSELARRVGLGAELDKLDRDGIRLRSSASQLVVSGRRARGTLFAAYELLERLGCRWVLPGPFGELYPQSKTLTVNLDLTQNPSHRERYWWNTFGQGKEFPQWSLRNKGTIVKALDDQAIAQGHALSQPLAWGTRQPQFKDVLVKEQRTTKRNVKQPDGTTKVEEVQTEVVFLPDEYYALVLGKPNRHVPNMSNPKVWQLYADYYIDYFNRNPFVDYVSISAEDGLVLDDRKESQALDSFDYDPFMGAYSATDRMWFFHRRFIEKVKAVHPGRKYGVLVYANNMTPPRLERVLPEMALIIAPLGISPLHRVGDPKSKTNRVYQHWLEAWMAQATAVGAETYYYDYDPIGFSWNHLMICPQWALIGQNYPYFHRLGLTGHTTQGHDDWGSSGFNHWVMIRLFWDINQDYKQILKEYCQVRFGAAAPAVLAYLDVLEQRMAEIPDLCSNEVWGNHLVLTPEVRSAARAALAQAPALPTDSREARHFATVVAMQRSTDAFCDGIELARETGDFAAARAKMDEAFAIRDELNKLYSHFVQPNRTDKTTKAEYLSGGWYNKYVKWEEKLKGSAASVVLPRTMKIVLDSGNVAAAKGWHLPGADVSALPDGDSTLIPDVTYGTQREVAGFFYRTEVDIPTTFAGKKRVELYFPSLIARAVQVWIDGQPVAFDHGDYRDATWRGPKYFWYDYDHQVSLDVTPLIKPGQRQTIAFRVFKSFDHGGSYDRVFLVADPPAAAKQP
jgi:hypothetical protein